MAEEIVAQTLNCESRYFTHQGKHTIELWTAEGHRTQIDQRFDFMKSLGSFELPATFQQDG